MADALRNPGFTDKFTCPSCYRDFHGRKGQCPNCGLAVKCSVEQEPVTVCERRTEGDDDDES